MRAADVRRTEVKLLLPGITSSLQVQLCPLRFHVHVWGWVAETSRENIQGRGRLFLIVMALFSLLPHDFSSIAADFKRGSQVRRV